MKSWVFTEVAAPGLRSAPTAMSFWAQVSYGLDIAQPHPVAHLLGCWYPQFWLLFLYALLGGCALP